MTQSPNTNNNKPDNSNKMPDENMQIFAYGSIKIIDFKTGEVLVNKSF
jgi:hypothetical protein